ncbi:MAG: ABC transporter substrate-binding protein, partial [Acidobacteria bacterium]|nr:ABC transporter substrate-binding protein [Acidobacteriota bacterium]
MSESWRQLNKRGAVWLAVLLIGAGLAACSHRPPASQISGTRTFTDELGREVKVQFPPQRIISLAPSVTETLFALGLGDKVVGVTAYCDFPEAARTKEKIGDTLSPNPERLIALKPDLVVMTTASQLEKLLRQLGDLNIAVYVTDPRSVGDVLASIRKLGEVTGATSEAETLVRRMQTRIAEVEIRTKALPKPRVLYVLQTAPLITAGRNTFINHLIQLAGADSISGNEQTDYPQLSRETAIARSPEVIVAPVSHGTELVKEDDLRRDFAATPAIKTNRIVWVNPDWVDRPGPRLVDGLEQLAKG